MAPEQRRAQLLNCAIRVFARRGMGQAHHAEVAKDAGVSVSTVFFYFPTRADLVNAVLAEVGNALTGLTADVAKRDKPAPEAIWDYGAGFIDFVDSDTDLARVWLDWSTAIRDEVWPRYLELQEQVVADVRGTIERGQAEGSVSARIDSDDAARLMVGATATLAQMKFSGRPADKVDHFLKTLTDASLGVAANG